MHTKRVAVGDSKGHTLCLKLSPNLRKKTKEVVAALQSKDEKKAAELEVNKLEAVLSQVKMIANADDDDGDLSSGALGPE